jgi:hypothetical protein
LYELTFLKASSFARAAVTACQKNTIEDVLKLVFIYIGKYCDKALYRCEINALKTPNLERARKRHCT